MLLNLAALDTIIIIKKTMTKP